MHIEIFQDLFMKTYSLYLKKPVKRDGINTNVKAKANRWFNLDCYRAKQDFKFARNAFIRNKTDANRNVFTKFRTKYNSLKYKAKLDEESMGAIA